MSFVEERMKGNCPWNFPFAKFECEQVPPVVEHASHLENDPLLCAMILPPQFDEAPDEPPELCPPDRAIRVTPWVVPAALESLVPLRLAFASVNLGCFRK